MEIPENKTNSITQECLIDSSIKTEISSDSKSKFRNNKKFQDTEIIQVANNMLKFPSKTIKQVEISQTNNFLNKRIELNGYCGTIKYLGCLQHKKENDSELWLGIEWDEETRGKHNGIVENFNYFETKNNKNSGSLIKISKVNFGLELEEALNFKYNFENQKNDMYAFMNNIVENERYIQANKKRIEIEFIGREKAIKKFSDYKAFPRIDLGYSYLSNISSVKENLDTMFPRLQELNLTGSLLSKWTDFALIVLSLRRLESLNFSENKLAFDDEFFNIKNLISGKNTSLVDIKSEIQFDKSNENSVQEYKEAESFIKIANVNISAEMKSNLNLKNLILNKNYLCLEKLMKISFLFPSLENLYLFDNQINENNIPENLDERIVSEFKNNLEKLRGLILEKNNITNIEKLLNYLPYKNLMFLNLNQNNIKHLISKESFDLYSKSNSDENNNNLGFDFINFFRNLKILNLDFNAIYDYELLFNQLKFLSNLEELNILNNGFVRNQLLGMENAKVNIIGRLLKLIILNHTTISKEIKRDSELLYLKSSVKDYFTNKLKEEFNLKVFEEYMKEFHPNYFVLKKKYYDPVEDFIEGVKAVNTNTIKGNMLEYTFMNKEKTLKKKFPKTTTFYNLKNLLIKLFKINGNFSFRIISGVLLSKLKAFNFKKPLEEVDKEDHSPDEIFDITDESKPLEDFNIVDNDVILLL